MLPLLGDNHYLTLLHKAKHFFCIEETVKFINKFDFVYIINPSLHADEAFRYQV